jgi:outer membrane receptor protein involved in Fe transport
MRLLGRINVGLTISLLLASAPAIAQSEDKTESTGMLEEIVVTAQKRVETLQDVPISIVALSGDTIQELNIYKMEDLQLKVPNLQMTESGISTQIYIRGIGSGNNQSFEQSVGMYVDGIYYGRAQLIRQPIFDIERVEVLRGPQGILFGKNSIAGAVAYTTAQPSGEFSSYLRAEYDWDHNATLLEGMVNGGSDTLAARISVRKFDDDGWIYNVFEDRDEPSRDDFAIRGQLRWEPTINLDMNLKIEHQEFNTKGRQLEIIEDNPAIPGSPIPGATYAQILAALGHPLGIPEAELNNRRSADGGDFSENEVNNVTFTLNYAWGNNTLTAITGWMEYEYSDLCDCDYTGAPVFTVPLDEEYEQFSQEIRLASPGGATLDWLVGVFYQDSDLDFSDAIRVPQNSVLGLLDPALGFILNTQAARSFNQTSELFAAFGQATWNFNDNWALTVGARWTTEEKIALKQVNIQDLETGANVPDFPDSLAPAVYFGAFDIWSEQMLGHNVNGKRSEDAFLPLLRMEWRPNDSSMWYVSGSSGFKAGGFDARSNNIFSFEFENEDATTYEFGGKFSYWDGRAETNFALYLTNYDDLQISQFDGTLGFNVGNVKDTRVQGIEVDGRLLITDGLTWTYALAYLDHEYKDFENANCYNGEDPNGDVVDGVALCSRTGQSGQYTPEFTAYTSLDWIVPISSNWDLRLKGDLSYTDEQNVHVNLDPKYVIDAFTIIDLRVSVANENWDLALLGKNVTNEDFLTYVNNVPLSGSTFGTNTFYSFNIRERSWWVQLAWHY